MSENIKLHRYPWQIWVWFSLWTTESKWDSVKRIAKERPSGAYKNHFIYRQFACYLSLFHFHTFRCGLLLFVFCYCSYAQSSFAAVVVIVVVATHSPLHASYFCEWLFFAFKIKADLDEFCELLITLERIQIDRCVYECKTSISCCFSISLSTSIDVVWSVRANEPNPNVIFEK